MKKICCTALLCFPLTAFAYPIEVSSVMNGAEVTYETQELAADFGAIFLSNQGLSPARCTANFRSGPDTPKTRRTLLQPGEQLSLSARFTRDIIRLRIRLECELVQ